MNKNLLFILLLFAGMANAQIVTIPDANFKAKLIALGIDTNNDGAIQESEAAVVQSIDVSNSGISDLTGIAHFTSLYFLECSNNTISNLNLTGLTYLQVLYCANNQMASLNLTGVSNLGFLICSNNLLTSLNGVASTVSVLKFDHNRLTGFNAANLTNIRELDCSNNKLASFSITGAPELISIVCSSNLLTSINVDHLDSLVSLDCSYNNLTQLNIANLPDLAYVSAQANALLTTVNLNNLPSLEDLNIIGVSNENTGGGSTVTGNLTSLTLTNLPQIWRLNCSYNKLATLDLTNLTNLAYLDCSYNQLNTLSLVNLPHLTDLTCYMNKFQSLDISNLSALVTFRCGGGYRHNNQLINVLQNLTVAGLSNLNRFECYDTLVSTLDLTGLTALEHFSFSGIDNAGVLTDLNLNGSPNLKYLWCVNTDLTTLDVSNLVHLEVLECWRGQLTNLDLNGLTQLKKLNYSYNYLTAVSLVNLPLLETLDCSSNLLTSLNIAGLTSLISLGCAYNQLTTLNLTGLDSLVHLDFSNNNLGLANISGISPNLITLSCGFNNLTSLDISGFPALESLYCRQNLLTTLDLSVANNLKYLNCMSNQLANLNLSNLNNLTSLECNDNLLTTLNTGNLSNLTVLQCTDNQISTLDLSNNTLMEILSYSNNPLPNFDVSNLPNLKGLSCFETQTSVLDVSNLTKLQFLYCSDNLLQTLDVSNCVKLDQLSCPNNQLTTLFLKNGRSEPTIDFANNPNLAYICADTAQLYTLQTYLNSLGMSNTVSNSYCTFTPGGDHNTISGITIFDEDHNGCDVTDEVNPFIRLDIYDGTQTGSTVTNIDGSYSYYTNAGVYTISPNVENPTWFDFSPASANFNFADNDNNISTQDFCINAIGVHNDVEVVLFPVDFARPGFDATYKIVYKNKGNQMHSGSVSLTFDDARSNFVLSVPEQDTAAPNTLTWNFTNLMPFENRSIFVTLNVNAPTATPAVNNGDLLPFTTTVTPAVGDEWPLDNTFFYNQIVVGSYDPNDITCLEGDALAPTAIGKYLHYVVNFENTGTAAAENVVVKLDINPAEFDISSLQLMNASHAVFAEIRNNTIEFKFPNIDLQASAGDPPVGGHGSILFKMKSRTTLNAGDLVTNRANIYFDYNFPILTQDAETAFSLLRNEVFTQDDSVLLFPNPTHDKVNIQAGSTIKSIGLYDIQGRILSITDSKSMHTQLDLSAQSSGIYFVKISTEKGQKVEKIIKE